MGKLAVALLLAALLLGGCRVAAPAPQPTGAPTVTLSAANGEVDVPFETIAVGELGMRIISGSPMNPHLVLLTSLEQIGDIANWLPVEALADLQQVDFEQYAVVVLFRGRQGSTNYQTVIERITRQDNNLLVSAQFWYPNPMYESGAAETSPYHLVKVDKQHIPSRSVELALQAHMLTPTPPASRLSK